MGDCAGKSGTFMTNWNIHSLAVAIVSTAMCLAASAAQADSRIVVGGTGSPLGSMQMLADAYMKDNSDTNIVVLPSLGSGGGIKGLIAGKIDIALSTRTLNEDEVAEGLNERPFAKTPIVFATNAANLATEASLDWILGAYEGTITEWPDGSRIRLVLRPLHDSDSLILSEASPAIKTAFEAAHERQGLIIADDAQEAADALEGIDGSLGTSTLTQVISEGRALRALTLDGKIPSAATLADGSYPFDKSFYMVTGPGISPDASAFVAFIRSYAGKAVLVASGNLPLE